ncbi:DNA-binding response regulator [Epilithonimonas vandammei]|jgi:DNA-binding NarL/FixJ family response regulator|uniref:Histidine kinase n=2 Tax=Flavobacteriales TaxID=200644 RepID=A0A2U8QT39_9FLAO|nr:MULTISPECIES: response regulator transcription factor [Bacteroidota]MBF01277.1 histidine kinase [Flavobacterium sp.]HBI88369.1 histidine kinase [Sphingobacterium sp.]AWM13323.1 histidine kinase [Flavobacterium sediminis]AZI56033.1 DNA-binding response regulator [Epilithonimonas vandammei]MBS5795416.1 response regulator transcription factor [Dysgonomonas mossii]|tara:strand:- start:54323 stop:54772 length:450 start_codon:yes stop_codon:yes gene_type:complete
METVNNLDQTSIAFINDKSPILDLTNNDLVASGINVLFRSENIEDGISQLSSLKTLPKVFIIDLDFHDMIVLTQLRELRTKYPNIKLIAYSDIDVDKTVKAVLEIGFESYLLIGSDTDDFKKAIEVIINGGRYFSVGIAKIAQEYFTDN